MQTPFISYLVTCKNEGPQLASLLNCLFKYKDDSECIILDDFSDAATTIEILNNTVNSGGGFFQLHKHALDKNYSAHKNYGKSLCKGKYIFQIDADELPNESLLASLKDIIELNPDIDLFWLPRINDFIGVTHQNATQWGWRLTPYEDRLIVNWPDPQGRLFKNISYLRWERRLHEKIEGAKTFTYLPAEYEYSLYHYKTIEKQIETNLKYNNQFTSEENQGFKLC